MSQDPRSFVDADLDRARDGAARAVERVDVLEQMRELLFSIAPSVALRDLGDVREHLATTEDRARFDALVDRHRRLNPGDRP